MHGERPKRKTRSHHSNSRSGCITCKRRHKKCDETHPACLNCTGLGRECEGYELVIDRRRREWRETKANNSANDQHNVALQIRHGSVPSLAAIHLPLASAFQIDLTWNERCHLDFYQNRTAVRFWQYFQIPFWDVLVMQMSESCPAVRHATIAMSAWHSQSELSSISGTDRDTRLALSHSTKAITYLRESLAGEILTPGNLNRTHKQIVLVTCVVLTILTLSQGDLPSSRYHIASGYKLLKDWDIQKDECSTSLALRQAFAQLHVHWSFCSHPELFFNDLELRLPPNTTAAPPKITQPLSTGTDHMDRVQQFSMMVAGFILDVTASGFDIGPASSIIRGGEVVSAKLRLCRSRLRAFLVELNSLPPDDCDSLRILALWNGVIDIKLAVAKSQKPAEMVYDDYLKQFQRLAKLLREMVGPGAGSNDLNISPFYYRLSVLPVILWSGAKCRDWLVRRELCSILYERPGDDNWISGTTVALKRLIAVESGGVKQGHTIPEAARAYCVNVKILSEESKVELRYRRSQSHPKDGSDQWERDLVYY